MKRALIVVAIAVLLAVGPTSQRAIADTPREAEADLEAPTPSAPLGLDGEPIEATIRFFDSGTQITVVGEAENLIPGRTYVSLVYDNGSVESGPNACEPTGGLTPAQMFLGVWVVDSHGNGTLNGGLAQYTRIGTFRTVSVRDTSVNGGFGPQAVAACGLVEADDD